MYLDFFGLHEKPFSIAPDPRYLYLTDQHKEALAHLNFGVGDEGGFIVLTGDVGTGKTTVCRSLLNQLPKNVEVAFVINPKVSALEMLEAICDDLDVHYTEEPTIKSLVDALNTHLLSSYACGKHTILIIDEAQNLADDVLEQLRLLTNLETNEKKLLQLILLGQPELREKLNSQSMINLSQRVTARFHLQPLNLQETTEYIYHRLHVAGFRGELFSRSAIRHVYKKSGGVPRLINVICDRCMLGAYTAGVLKVEYPLVVEASKETLAAEGISPFSFSKQKAAGFIFKLIVAFVLVGLLAYGVGFFFSQMDFGKGSSKQSGRVFASHFSQFKSGDIG